MNTERKDSILEILKKIDEDAYKRGFEDGKKAGMEMSDLTTTFKWDSGFVCEKCGVGYSPFFKVKIGEKCLHCQRIIMSMNS